MLPGFKDWAERILILATLRIYNSNCYFMGPTFYYPVEDSRIQGFPHSYNKQKEECPLLKY